MRKLALSLLVWGCAASLQLVTLSSCLAQPNCTVKRGTACVGYLLSNFAQGHDLDSILSDLDDRFCGCTHITGNLRINLATSGGSPSRNLTEKDFSFLYYIEEISGVLTFQNIPPLPSLTIPNLEIIRGDDSIVTSEGDSLVFYVIQSQLEQLYMPRLSEITQGDVLFSEVGSLCTYKTVNWNDILNAGRLIDNNTECAPQDLADCSGCNSGMDPSSGNILQNCWSSVYCHILSKVVCPTCGTDRCYSVSGSTLQCCNPLCAAGCTGSKSDECLACNQFENNGTCVTNCPPDVIYNPDTFQLENNPDYRLEAGDLCVEECPVGLFELSGSCLLRCPDGYFSEGGKCFLCDGPCPIECDGLSTAESLDSITIERFRREGGCSIITSGGLYIADIDTTNTPTEEQLQLLETITEIKGDLRIQEWSRTSFPYLKNLQYIGSETGTKFESDSSPLVLAIYNNPTLREIDLRSLKEIRSGGFGIGLNPELCYTGNLSIYLEDSSYETAMISPLRKAANECEVLDYICHDQCDSTSNCWGSDDTQCDGCRNYRYQTQCVEDCAMVTLVADSSGLFQNSTSLICDECDEQCLGGCTNGTGSEHCTACRNYFVEIDSGAATETVCVEECPIGTWLNNATEQCVPCSVHCRSGCAGPLPNLNLTDGCLECDVVELDRDGGQVKCVRVCDIGTYEDTLTVGENEVLEELLPELLVCRPCHELCKDCVGPGTLSVGGDCHTCAVVANQTSYCVERCDNTTGGPFQLGGICLLRCPDGYLSEEGKCFLCNGSCPTVVCLDDFLITGTGNYSWPSISAGAAHSQPCGIPRPSMDGLDPEVAVRKCDSMGSWLEVDDAMCLTLISESFAEIGFIVESGNLTEENYKQVIQEVASLAMEASARDQTEENFVVVTEILLASAAMVQDPEVTVTEEEQVVTDILSILDTVEEWPDDAIGSTASLAVLAFERIIEVIALQENFTQFTYSEDIHVIAQRINSSVLGKGTYGFSVHLDNGALESITTPIAGQDLDLEQVVGAVILPESLLQLILTENATEEVSAIFTFYRQSNLFPVTRQPTRAEGLETVVGSPVLGASVANQTVADLSDPVTIILELKEKNATSNIRCASYDFTLFAWSAEGCETQVTGGVVHCTCNHLTNFGVLVDVCTRTGGCELSEEEEFALEVTSIIGAVLSLFGIVLTIVTLVGFKKLRERDVTKFHVQLCLAIGCMLIVFMVGIDQTDPFGGCVAVSVLIQYFTLASVMWMGAEALLMFQKLVIVFASITRRYLIFVSFVCWLAPLIPVVIPLAINREFMVTYVDDSKTDVDFCFIGEPGVFFGTILGPIIAIILSNLVVFFIIISVLVRHNAGPAGNRKEKLGRKKAFRLIVGISGVTFLLGLTWLFGAFTVTDASFAFQFLFALFNTLQGFFMFLCFCVLNNDAREAWKGVFARGHYKPTGPLLPLRKCNSTKPSTPTSPTTELAYGLPWKATQSEQMVSEDKDSQHVEKRKFDMNTLTSKREDAQIEGDGDKGATQEDIQK